MTSENLLKGIQDIRIKDQTESEDIGADSYDN